MESVVDYIATVGEGLGEAEKSLAKEGARVLFIRTIRTILKDERNEGEEFDAMRNVLAQYDSSGDRQYEDQLMRMFDELPEIN